MMKALALLLLSSALQAAPFDKGGLVGVGAREAGQSGAVVARAEDSDALWWNPAGLNRGRDFDLGLHYGHVLGGSAFDTAFDHRGWIEPLELGYGAGYRHVGFRSGADEEEIALGLAFPFTDDQRLNVGVRVRSLQSRLGVAGVDARGYGLDLGLTYRPPLPGDALTLGLALRDFQAELNWSTGVSAPPVQLLQAGAAWAFDADSSIEFDTEMASDPAMGSPSGQGFKIGAERWWGLKRYGLKKLAALRLGYAQNSALAPTALGGELSFGLGLQYDGLRVDYALGQDVSALGLTHRVSGAYRFGQAGAPKPSPTPSPAPTAVTTPAATPAALSLSVTASAVVFNPLSGAARLGLKVAASGPLNEVAETRLEIVPNLGPAVFSQVRRGLAPDLTWDGRQSAGSWAPVGGYAAQVAAVDAQGLTLASAEAKFQLDLGGGKLRLLPEADIFAPIGQSERKSANVAVGYQGAGIQRWTLTITREGSAKPVRILSGRKLPARLAWDGFNSKGARVADGGYRLDLSLLTVGGGTLNAQTRLDVDTRRPNLDLNAEPLVFEAKGDVGAVTFSLGQSAEAGIPARWSLSVETLTGKKLKSFAGKGSPPAQLVWNGTDEAGKPVAGGAIYYVDFVVAMESGALARQPRVALASKLEEPKQPFKVTLQSVHFDEGEESVSLEEYTGLKETAAAIKKYGADYVVLVNGYAGLGEAGKAGLGEIELSFLRAKAVRDFLVEAEGLPSDKVRSVGNGPKSSPAGSLPGPAARAAARVVDVIIYAQ
jgi:outer membrane protein OmpA-like peptidoglycan-associated protein